METAPTADTVACNPALNAAIARLVAGIDGERYEELLNDLACEALTVYHECGHPEVDTCSEGLGVTLYDMVEDEKRAGRRGEALRRAVVQAIVDNFDTRFGD